MSTCIFCDRRVSSKEVLPLRDWKNVAICTACYAGWEKNGKKCGACGTVVHGMPEVSAFEKPKRTLSRRLRRDADRQVTFGHSRA